MIRPSIFCASSKSALAGSPMRSSSRICGYRPLRSQAAKNGVQIDGAELYTTASPCWPCFKLIANAGIVRIYYGEFYRDERSPDVARRLGIELISLEGTSA